MGENLEISRNELEKANNILSNFNQKLMTDFIQYLMAKSFYINPDKSQYSSYPYHPDEIVESLVGDSVAINVPQRSKKWVAFEDMTLLHNWNTFLADQPPHFKRLSAILLKKPCSYNILTDTLNFNNGTGKGNNSSLCGTIKLKQLIIDYNRITKLYARLGKGICRCLNSCYYRAKLVLVGSGNPQVTGPFSEPEAHLCYNLYKSLHLNPNHTLDYVCEQIGKSLNRPPQLIDLFLETLEQIKENSIPKIACSPPKNTTNILNTVSNIIPSVPFASQSSFGELSCPIPTLPQQSFSIPVEFDSQVRVSNPPMSSSLRLVALVSAGPGNSGNPYDSHKCRAAFTQGILCSKWPSKVTVVLVQVIKWHYKYELGFDFEALAQQVTPGILRSILSCFEVDWQSIVRTLIKSCTNLPLRYLDPCLQMFAHYWRKKLMQLFYLNLTDEKTLNNAQSQPVYYKPAYLDSFFTRLRVFVALKKPEKVQHALLISSILRSNATPKAPLEWDKVTPLYNAESNDSPHMTGEQLKKMFDDLKQTYMPIPGTMSERRIINCLSFTLTGKKDQVTENGGRFKCYDKIKSLDLNHTLKDRPNVPKIVGIEDEYKIVKKQSAVGNGHESVPLQKDSTNSTPKTLKKDLKAEEKVCLTQERSHLSDNLGHKKIENVPLMAQELDILSKIKKEDGNSDGNTIFERADFKFHTELMGKDKADQELTDMRQSGVRNNRKIERIIWRNRMNLTPEQLRLYELTLVPLYDKGILDRIKTDLTPEICEQEQNINTHFEAKGQHDVDENIPIKLKKIKKLKDTKAETIELEDNILEVRDSKPVKEKHKNTTDFTVKKKSRQNVENKLELFDQKTLKQKLSKSKTPEIIEFATELNSGRIKERCQDEEIVNKPSETPSKKLMKSKKRETKESSTGKKIRRKKKKTEAQELNMDDNPKIIKPEIKEMTICKKVDFESLKCTNEACNMPVLEDIIEEEPKKRTKSKKSSINQIDQGTILELAPSSHERKHKMKVGHHVNDEDKNVLIKIKKDKVKEENALNIVEGPIFDINADQDVLSVSLNNQSLNELPRKKKPKKIIDLNENCQEAIPKIKKRDKKSKSPSETVEHLSLSPTDHQLPQNSIKNSKKRRKIKCESYSLKKGESSAFAKTDNTNLSDDELIQLLSPAKINVTRDNVKKHLVITIEDSDDICEMEDDRVQTLGSDKVNESIKLQKLIEALGDNPNNQYRIINEIRKTVKLRST